MKYYLSFLIHEKAKKLWETKIKIPLLIFMPMTIILIISLIKSFQPNYKYQYFSVRDSLITYKTKVESLSVLINEYQLLQQKFSQQEVSKKRITYFYRDTSLFSVIETTEYYHKLTDELLTTIEKLQQEKEYYLSKLDSFEQYQQQIKYASIPARKILQPYLFVENKQLKLQNTSLGVGVEFNISKFSFKGEMKTNIFDFPKIENIFALKFNF